MFLKDSLGAWVDSRFAWRVGWGVSTVDGAKWAVFLQMTDGIANVELAGLYASDADAEAGAAKLAQGFDPSTLVP